MRHSYECDRQRAEKGCSCGPEELNGKPRQFALEVEVDGAGHWFPHIFEPTGSQFDDRQHFTIVLDADQIAPFFPQGRSVQEISSFRDQVSWTGDRAVVTARNRQRPEVNLVFTAKGGAQWRALAGGDPGYRDVTEWLLEAQEAMKARNLPADQLFKGLKLRVKMTAIQMDTMPADKVAVGKSGTYYLALHSVSIVDPVPFSVL